VIAAVVAAVSINTLRTTGSRRTIMGHGLLVGGAAGNLVDRFQHRPHFPAHAVVDWIASASLPTFNLADVAIVAGLGLLATTAASTTAASTTPPVTTLPPTTPSDHGTNP
jgi:signal peptidase II